MYRNILETLILVAILHIRCNIGMCLHDRLSSTQPPADNLLHSKNFHDRYRRQAVSSSLQYDDESDDEALKKFFQPIRLRLWLDDANIEFNCSSEEYKRLKEQTQRAADKLATFISVIPIEESLSFDREGLCRSIWVYPGYSQYNQKRCAEVNTDYNGEFCMNEFKIPDKHLNGFKVYDKSHSAEGRVIYENGTGIAEADTVIYIGAHETEHCRRFEGAIAYASYCKLGPHYRPVAGYANFCPQYLKADLYNSDRLYLTALHEFIHALGFSKSLFDKFQTCKVQSMKVKCRRKLNTVGRFPESFRLMSPNVRKVASDHFSCPNCKGVSLENVYEKQLSSHWEMRVMYTSLMTAKLGLPHLVALDSLTLAALQDTGWYQINMSHADDFLWGKNEGCQFGTVKYCKTNNKTYYCNPNSSSNGCHFLGLNKGVCETDNYLDGCGVYKATPFDQCNNDQKLDDSNSSKRCFLSSINTEEAKKRRRTRRSTTSNENEGKCYERRCFDERMQIKVGNSNWLDCVPETWIEFPGIQGAVWCPSQEAYCKPKVSFNQGYVSTICARVSILFPGLSEIFEKTRNNRLSVMNSEKKIIRNLLRFVDSITFPHGAKATSPARIYQDQVFFSLQSFQSRIDGSYILNCSASIESLRKIIDSGSYILIVDGNKTNAKKFKVWYPTDLCPEDKKKNMDFSEVVKKAKIKLKKEGKNEPLKESSGSKSLPKAKNYQTYHHRTSRTGTIAAWTILTISSSVLLSVVVLAIFKSVPPRSVSPGETETHVTYTNNEESNKNQEDVSTSPPDSISSSPDCFTTSITSFSDVSVQPDPKPDSTNVKS